MAKKATRERWEVRPNGKLWVVTNGNSTLTVRYKATAVTTAVRGCRRMLKDGIYSELTIKRRDGTIQDKRTYGRDPRRTEG